MPRNLGSDVVTFLAYLGGRAPHTLRWDTGGRRSDGRPATVLILRDRIPRPPFRAGAPQFVVTSAAHRLRASRFGSETSRAINTVAAKGHGRTLTCLAVGGEPIAALAYHREDHAPLLVTAIAVLPADSADPAIAALSRAMAGVLLCYLAAAAHAGGLPLRLTRQRVTSRSRCRRAVDCARRPRPAPPAVLGAAGQLFGGRPGCRRPRLSARPVPTRALRRPPRR